MADTPKPVWVLRDSYYPESYYPDEYMAGAVARLREMGWLVEDKLTTAAATAAEDCIEIIMGESLDETDNAPFAALWGLLAHGAVDTPGLREQLVGWKDWLDSEYGGAVDLSGLPPL